MPRSKYLAVFFALIAFAQVGSFAYGSLGVVNTMVARVPAQTALIIDAVDTEREAVVALGTSREKTRSSLLEQLRNYVSAEDPVVEVAVVPESVPSIILPIHSVALAPCANKRVSRGDASSWEPVEIRIAEGARLISSRALDDTGTPLHTLQLNATPFVTGGTLCVPTGMVGITLEGQIINSGVPFETNAEGIAGYALDGFGIYGTYENDSTVSNDVLDECHGHVHAIVWNGAPISMYHYHINDEAPYTLGCFRGSPASVN